MNEKRIGLVREDNKNGALTKFEKFVDITDLMVAEKNLEKPWGAYVRFESYSMEEFVDMFFSDLKSEIVKSEMELSPKLLLVAPGERLSWQYHNRRSEVWKVIEGEVGIKTSGTDEEPEIFTKHKPGDLIILKKGERHRLIGLSDWGLVAEIWVHEDGNLPSDENDIVRLQDDYERK